MMNHATCLAAIVGQPVTTVMLRAINDLHHVLQVVTAYLVKVTCDMSIIPIIAGGGTLTLMNATHWGSGDDDVSDHYDSPADDIVMQLCKLSAGLREEVLATATAVRRVQKTLRGLPPKTKDRKSTR